ncbi:MAG: HAD-IIB family hydrolase [Oscillospiraceae bacterium]|nr:HAD-IIB family hydrolase [Oscillospiraceae bacterium]
MKEKKIIAFDLDGTITQHRTELGDENKAVLEKLAEKYRLMIVGAGVCMIIWKQLKNFPIDIIGCYGMQYAKYNHEKQTLELIRSDKKECDKKSVTDRVDVLRKQFGYTEYAGESVDFHESGAVTIALLGTKAKIEDKLAFDPTREKRRPIYPTVVEMFPDFNVFVGGSSSFDMAPAPFNKYYALDRFCKEEGYYHEDIVFIGDDYGLGGNDESVYKSDFDFITVDDYRDLAKAVEVLL